MPQQRDADAEGYYTVARLFISHASANNPAAIALLQWLSEQGFEDVFLDIDPDRGVVPGERWQEALKAAADRCEAVLFLVSPAWLASSWCQAEFIMSKLLHKRIFGLTVEPVPFERLPPCALLHSAFFQVGQQRCSLRFAGVAAERREEYMIEDAGIR